MAGSYAYVADEDAGLRIINVANPPRPTRPGSTTRRGMPMAWRWRAATPTSPTTMRACASSSSTGQESEECSTPHASRITGRVPRHRGHFQFISFDCQHIKVTL